MEKEHGRNEEPDKTSARHGILSIFKESWRDDHRFFSDRDLELCVKGLCEGTYEMVEVELERELLQAFSSKEKEPDITMQLYMGEEDSARVLEKTVTPPEAQSLLMQMSDSGVPKELSGWKDITDTMKA